MSGSPNDAIRSTKRGPCAIHGVTCLCGLLGVGPLLGMADRRMVGTHAEDQKKARRDPRVHELVRSSKVGQVTEVGCRCAKEERAGRALVATNKKGHAQHLKEDMVSFWKNEVACTNVNVEKERRLGTRQIKKDICGNTKKELFLLGKLFIERTRGVGSLVLEDFWSFI